MNNQQTSQMPQGGQQNVPDHRLDEIMSEVRKLRDENNQLRGQIDYISQAKGANQQTQTPVESPFDPKVDKALNEKFQRMLQESLTGVEQKLSQQIGYVVDRTDELSFKQTYGSERFQKFHEKVDRLREDYQRRGQYIPREEALRIVYFEETGKKAHPEPTTQEPAKPEYDPYFGTMVDPQTKLPVQSQAATQLDDWGNPIPVQNQQVMPEQNVQQQSAQVPTQQTQQQAMPTGFEQRTNQTHPYNNPFNQPPQLPNQGMSPSAPGSQQGTQRMTLDLYASDDQLAAFEKNFGNVPL